jgi:hypothetical protein
MGLCLHTSDAVTTCDYLDDRCKTVKRLSRPRAPAPLCGHTEGPGHDCAYVEEVNGNIEAQESCSASMFH